MHQILRTPLRDPVWIAVLVGLFISFVNVITDELINSDGILYSEVAGKMLAGDWQDALGQFSWPFYPLLVGIVSKISFLNFEISAQLLNAGLLALLAYVFVRCSQLMGGDRLVAICAAILLLTNVTLNGYRDLVIRDHGYWALFFTALYFLLQYHRTKLTKHALGFGISILIATLFRVEGIVFTLLAPLILLFQDGSWRQRIYQSVLPLLPLIVAALIALLFVFFSPALMEKMASAVKSDGSLLGPLNYFQTNLQGVFSNIAEKARLLEEHVFDLNARNMGTKSMIAILLMTLIVKIISATGYIPVIFSIFAGVSDRLRHSISGGQVIIGFMLINLLVLTTVVASKLFLTPRYAMTMALLLTLPAAFGLADFFRAQVTRYSAWKQRGKVLLIIILAYMFLDGLISTGSSKAYIRESGLWLKEHAPAEARLLSNNAGLYYYSGREVDRNILHLTFEETRFARLPAIAETFAYDYLAIKVGRKQKGFEAKIIAWAGSQPVHRAANERGDTVLIFAVKK